ncbi:hypothetical protein ACOXBV_004659, partial [Salmonella enterica subsp. enterica serovar Uganda]
LAAENSIVLPVNGLYLLMPGWIRGNVNFIKPHYVLQAMCKPAVDLCCGRKRWMTNMLTYIAAHLAECKDGVWSSSSVVATFSPVVIGVNESISLGKKQYCGLSYIYLDDLNKHVVHCSITKDGNNNWFLNNYRDDSDPELRCQAICF